MLQERISKVLKDTNETLIDVFSYLVTETTLESLVSCLQPSKIPKIHFKECFTKEDVKTCTIQSQLFFEKLQRTIKWVNRLESTAHKRAFKVTWNALVDVSYNVTQISYILKISLNLF